MQQSAPETIDRKFQRLMGAVTASLSVFLFVVVVFLLLHKPW